MADGDLTSLATLKTYLNLPWAWVKSTAVVTGDRCRANSALYECITTGTTNSTGSGPSGTSTDITDGTAHWKYIQANLRADDTTLARLISSVSIYFATYCARTFASTDWVYTTDGTNGTVIALPEWPVTDVDSVVINTATIPARPRVGAYGWVQVGDNEIRVDGAGHYAFPRGVANVVITFTAGYDTIPADLEQACLECCASWYKRKDRIDENSKTTGQETLTYSTGPVPDTAKAVLDRYRRVWPKPGGLVAST
jgi:hypothetical protein